MGAVKKGGPQREGPPKGERRGPQEVFFPQKKLSEEAPSFGGEGPCEIYPLKGGGKNTFHPGGRGGKIVSPSPPLVTGRGEV